MTNKLFQIWIKGLIEHLDTQFQLRRVENRGANPHARVVTNGMRGE